MRVPTIVPQLIRTHWAASLFITAGGRVQCVEKNCGAALILHELTIGVSRRLRRKQKCRLQLQTITWNYCDNHSRTPGHEAFLQIATVHRIVLPRTSVLMAARLRGALIMQPGDDRSHSSDKFRYSTRQTAGCGYCWVQCDGRFSPHKSFVR